MDVHLAATGNWDVLLGAPVYDAAGEKLGTVRHADAYGLLVTRGFIFTSDIEIPLDEVDRFEDGRLILKWTKADLQG